MCLFVWVHRRILFLILNEQKKSASICNVLKGLHTNIVVMIIII